MARHHDLNTEFGDVGRRSVHGGLALLSTNTLQLAITVVTTMVLARVLTPGDFGFVAMGTILINLAAPIRNFGLPPAIVHERDLDHDQLSELFWLNLKLTAILTAAMGAMAPPIAAFFGKPALIWVMLVLILGCLARGTANLQPGLLQRQMRFGAISMVRTGALSTGAVVAIVWALWTASYWALVVQQLVMFLGETALLWLACPWRPQRPRSTPTTRAVSVRTMITFGRDATLIRMVSEAGSQMDRILLGRFVGAEQLGLYQNAHRWASVPALRLLQPMRTVAVSGFSRLKDEQLRYRRYAQNAFTVMVALTIPMFVLLCIEARAVVLLLLGPQWEGAIQLFQVLAIAMIFTVPERISRWVYLGEGQTRRGLHWQLISTLVVLASLIMGLPWGTVGVAIAFCAAKALLAYPALRFCLRTSLLRSTDFWSTTWRPAIATFCAALVVLALPPVGALSPGFLLLHLALATAAFAVVFALFWLALPGGVGTTRELVALLKGARTNEASEG